MRFDEAKARGIDLWKALQRETFKRTLSPEEAEDFETRFEITVAWAREAFIGSGM